MLKPDAFYFMALVGPEGSLVIEGYYLTILLLEGTQNIVAEMV